MALTNTQYKSFFNLIKDSIKYALSDWKTILVFGIILFGLSEFEEYVLIKSNYVLSIRIITAIILLIILSIFESGYSFKILNETIKGSKKLPLFSNMNELFLHGVKDNLVYLFYYSIFRLTIIVSIFLDTIIPEDVNLISLAIFLFGGYVFFFSLCALLNLAYNEGDIRAGFDFKSIRQILKKIGIFKLIMVFIFGIISEYLIITSLLQIGLFTSNSILAFLTDLIITPFLFIFTKRFFALSSKHAFK